MGDLPYPEHKWRRRGLRGGNRVGMGGGWEGGEGEETGWVVKIIN